MDSAVVVGVLALRALRPRRAGGIERAKKSNSTMNLGDIPSPAIPAARWSFLPGDSGCNGLCKTVERRVENYFLRVTAFFEVFQGWPSYFFLTWQGVAQPLLS